MNQVLPATRSAGLPAALAPEVASLTIDDSEYVLNVYVCPHCGQPHYRLCRFAGAFYSSYIPPTTFSRKILRILRELFTRQCPSMRRPAYWQFSHRKAPPQSS